MWRIAAHSGPAIGTVSQVPHVMSLVVLYTAHCVLVCHGAKRACWGGSKVFMHGVGVAVAGEFGGPRGGVVTWRERGVRGSTNNTSAGRCG